MATIRAKVDDYVKEAIEAGEFSIEPKGLNLKSVSTLKWDVACLENNKVCAVIFRHNNTQYTLRAFPDQDQETTAATTARENIDTELIAIASDVQANGFHE